MLEYFFAQDNPAAMNFLFFIPKLLMKTASLGQKKHISFCQEVTRTDKSVAGNEINMEGVAGVSGWADIYCD